MTLEQQLPERICKSKYAIRPILYTDTIKGEQTLRDDLWAVSTEELNELSQHSQRLIDRFEEMIKTDYPGEKWCTEECLKNLPCAHEMINKHFDDLSKKLQSLREEMK